ncbi:hypothetical protein Tco_1365001 [Tanacetum coccineum]
MGADEGGGVCGRSGGGCGHVDDDVVVFVGWSCDEEGGVIVAAVDAAGVEVVLWGCEGEAPKKVEARGGEWIWGSGRSGHEDNIWFRPERSPENFSGGGGMVAGGGGRRGGWPDNYGRWRRERESL